MSVNVETPIASATANGVTTAFPYSFTVLAAADLVVKGTLSGITTTYTLGDYSVIGVGTNAGSVNFLVAPANGTVITMYRDSVIERPTDYQDSGDLLAETVNSDFDRVWLVLQELVKGARGLASALRAPPGEVLPELGDAAARAGRIQAYDSLGNPIFITGTDSSSATDLALDLADTTNAAKGAGKVGFAYGLSYGAGTVGKWLKDLATATGATFIGWKAAATGSILRTLYARLGDRVSVLDFGADPTGATNSAAAIQSAIDSAKRVFIPNGNYDIGTTGLQITDNTVLDFESRAARIFGTVAGAMISSKNNGTTRRYDAMIFSGVLDNTNRATAGGIGLDLKAMSRAKVFGLQILNVETGVRCLGVNPTIGCFYNDLFGVDISGVVTGVDNGTLANAISMHAGRINDCVTCWRDNDNTGNSVVSTSFETFTGRAILVADTTATQGHYYQPSRIENGPIGIDIRAAAQYTKFDIPNVISVATPYIDAATTKDTNGESDGGIMLKSGTPLKKIQYVSTTIDFGSIAAHTTSETFVAVTGLLSTDFVIGNCDLNREAGLMVEAVPASGGFYIRVLNGTAAGINPASHTYNAVILRF